MACDKKILTLLSAYADGEATPEEAARATAHIGSCTECRRLVEEWQGQRQLLEWAYTSEWQNEISAQELERLAQKEQPMSTIEAKTPRTPISISWRLNWAWAGALTAAAIMAFIIYRFVFMPPVLQVGKMMATGYHSQAARIGGDISLKIGPDSEISRPDNKTIRLEKGWVTASIRNRAGLRVLTDRMEVVDQGTKFEVGTGPKFDYVMVDRGSVSVTRGNSKQQVKAGQVLVAQDKGEFLSSLPSGFVEEYQGVPLNEHRDFEPTDAESLDWQEGLQRLAVRFPDVRMTGGGGGETFGINGLEFHFKYSPMVGLKSGLQEHYADILQAMSGGTVDSGGCGGWYIPVAVVQISDVISDPELPADVYYVRLVCEDGGITWHFTGSNGRQAYYPLDAEDQDADDDTSSGDSRSYPISTRLSFSMTKIVADNKPTVAEFKAQLADWPGKIKPTLNLEGGTPISESQQDEQAMLAEVARRIPSSFKPGSSSQLYLDPKRKNRLLIVWNEMAPGQLIHLQGLAKQGHGGSVILGAVMTDVPLEEPKAKAGIYLLRFVQSAVSKSPRMELIAPDTQNTILALRPGKPGDPDISDKSYSFKTLSDFGLMQFKYGAKSAEHGVFPFQFRVTGRPDWRTEDADSDDGVWAEGWIKVKQP